MKVKVYGHSDDWIEVEGGKLTDEFSGYGDARLLLFSDGTVLKIEYSPKDYSGKWKIERTKQGSADYSHVPAPEDEDEGYSDRVTLTGDLKWVRCQKGMEITREEILEKIDTDSLEGLSLQKLRAIYEVFMS